MGYRYIIEKYHVAITCCMRDRSIKIALFILTILALVSIGQGIANALRYSQDFQWSPTVLFWKNINPYQYYLDGNVADLMLSQFPNYSHLLYVILWPFSLLQWGEAKLAWAISNVAMALGSLFLLFRYYRRPTARQMVFIAALFLMGTPFRNAVGNGQLSLFILFMTLLCWKSVIGNKPFSNVWGAVALALSVTKYSFAVPFVAALLLEKKWMIVVLCISIYAATVLFFALNVNANPLDVVLQPLLVAERSVSPGVADLYSILKYDFAVGSPLAMGSLLAFLSLFFVFVIYGRHAVQLSKDDPTWLSLKKLSALSVVSLIFFPHLGYDYVFLLPMLCYVVTARIGMLERFVIWACLGWFFFGIKIVSLLGGYGFQRGMGFVLLVLAFMCLLKNERPPDVT